jgi:hypothetical protein
MTREKLLELLRSMKSRPKDEEAAHWEADKALVEYIGDVEITEAWKSAQEWFFYA